MPPSPSPRDRHHTHHQNQLRHHATDESSNSSNTNHTMTMDSVQPKCSLVYREDAGPGLAMEMVLKRILVSTESSFQKIDVLETYFGKTLITDGKTQSSQLDEFAYHESLVHPVMLKAIHHQQSSSTASAPPSHWSVFIGGGGELATAREVLRYPGVSRVLMVDLDAKVVEVCQQHLPEWGGTTVLHEPRFQLVIGDAYEYLMNTREQFDVIIMDISDPVEAGPGVMLYTKEFYEHARTLLKAPHGVLVTQSGMAESIPLALGSSPSYCSSCAETTDPSCFAPIHNTLRSVFDCVIPYSVDIPSFGCDWGYNMAFQAPRSITEPVVDTDLVPEKLEQEWKRPRAGLVGQLVEQHITGGAESLRFYDEETHFRMFALTKPLRDAMALDDRIMTRDNPVFMY